LRLRKLDAAGKNLPKPIRGWCKYGEVKRAELFFDQQRSETDTVLIKYILQLNGIGGKTRYFRIQYGEYRGWS
jgi:hypothetical protein